MDKRFNASVFPEFGVFLKIHVLLFSFIYLFISSIFTFPSHCKFLDRSLSAQSVLEEGCPVLGLLKDRGPVQGPNTVNPLTERNVGPVYER